MLTLPNGCSCSKISVHPKNWEKVNPDISADWYIHYRFYDPRQEKPKQVVIKGMNVYKTLPERRSATKALLDNEKDMLLNQGYNPFLKQLIPEQDRPGDEFQVHPNTPFIAALNKAKDRLIVTPRVKIGIKSIITGLEKAASQLGYRQLSISTITRRHIKALLDQCSHNTDRWSNNRFNTYRGYLMMLYKELVELEAAPLNPMHDISKKPVEEKIKKTLNAEQRTLIDNHLSAVFPAFHKFIHLFFHSGGRKTELLQLKPANVDLLKQQYTCVVKKGKRYRQVERTIKSIALPFWEFFLNGCPDGQFIFGPNFNPGQKPMGEDMPTKYWRKFIKQDLNIDIDFYSLKHLNTTEVVDALDERAAAALNAHQSTAMVIGIYDIKQKHRQHDRIKNINNKFA